MASRILTQRCKEKLSHDGHLFIFDRSSSKDKEIHFWRCERKDRCKARLHTKDGEIVKALNEHTHGPSPAQVQVACFKTSIRERAAVALEPPSVIINQCLTDISQASLAVIPSYDSLKKTINRKRISVLNVPNDPANLEELIIPESYRMYIPEPGVTENFLLCDRGNGNERIIIFGRQSWLKILVTSRIWFADGTFSIAPKLFSQCYVILAKENGGVHPIVYALLQNKSTRTYVNMFQILKEIEPNLNPASIVCDYEQAAHCAMRAIFPNVQIKGCFFHLGQNMQKHLASDGFISSYRNDPDFALKAKMIIALSFVPLSKIDLYFDTLANELSHGFSSLLNWFEDTYVGRQNRRGGGRRAPLFPHEIWNLHERVLNGEDRTNNYAEAAHRRLQFELGMNNPTIWKFIDGLRKVQKGRDTHYVQLSTGRPPKPKLQKYLAADQRIHDLVLRFDDMDAIGYLQSIAHNYQME